MRTDSPTHLPDDVSLSVRHLIKNFTTGGRWYSNKNNQIVSAVADISFDIQRGKTMGLVGESGCGKSTTARCILRLIDPTSGSVLFCPNSDSEKFIDLMAESPEELRQLRQNMQIIFQDPFASLNPRMTVGRTIEELLIVNANMSRTERNNRVRDLLDLVGLESVHAKRFPHEFSGGQRQRIGVARALALNPSFVVCDEPVSALDVSIQAQVLNLLSDLQQEFGLTYLFITHDLAVVRQICDDVAVMYLGKIVEHSPVEKLFAGPMHPYTQALVSAAPIPNPSRQRNRTRILLEGDVPSPINPPSGCRFQSRCPVGKAKQKCLEVEPTLTVINGSHRVACHFPDVRPVI
ncbi:MAG: ATP-binding cassette domain-containing protein [Dehalococcoidia bacterium]|jgi:oligopeptide/dipeptide ABC transporter ATP-binding protein|nr:ATP-binding cassette domain-containing protein [Dehalococcoidia bacterium]